MKRLILIQIIFALVFAFQNCARETASTPAAAASTDSVQKVIADTSAYTQIVYQSLSLPSLGLDLQAGSLQIGAKSCPLDSARLASLRRLMASSQICEVLPGSGPVCQAYSMPDIEFSNGQDSIQLRPVICKSGVVLCGGADQTLRDWIQEILENPPADCAP